MYLFQKTEPNSLVPVFPEMKLTGQIWMFRSEHISKPQRKRDNEHSDTLNQLTRNPQSHPLLNYQDRGQYLQNLKKKQKTDEIALAFTGTPFFHLVR